MKKYPIYRKFAGAGNFFENPSSKHESAPEEVNRMGTAEVGQSAGKGISKLRRTILTIKSQIHAFLHLIYLDHLL